MQSLDKPVQLVSIDNYGKCECNPHALELLRSIKSAIGVVAMVGPYRTGKSYLLNRLMNRQGGFEIGGTVQSCTKGLWIWGEPIKIRDNLSVLLLDTQGLNSINRNQHTDVKIFTLSLLLSSLFVFNSLNAIDERALESIGLVVNLSKQIHVYQKPKHSKEEDMLVAKYVPHFLWVIRDFALKLQDSLGRPIDERQYLESALRPVESGQDLDAMKALNEIRSAIAAYFRNRECFTLIRPVHDQKQLREVNSLPYESLRPKFREQSQTFCKKVWNLVTPKIIDGNALNGAMLADLCEMYVDAINSNEVPTITSSWERVVQRELRDSLDRAIKCYIDYLEIETKDAMPLEVDKLDEIDRRARSYGFRKLNETMITVAAPELLAQQRDKFLMEAADQFMKLKQKNWEASNKFCEGLLKALHEKAMSEFKNEDPEDWSALVKKWHEIKKEYLKKGKGPAKDRVMGDMATNEMLQDLSEFLVQFKQTQNLAMRQLEQDLAIQTQLSQNFRKALSHEREKSESDKRKLKQNFFNEKLRLEQSVATLTSTLRKNEEALHDMQSEIDNKSGHQTTAMPDMMSSRYSSIKPLDKRQIKDIVDQVYSKDTDVITSLIDKRLEELLAKQRYIQETLMKARDDAKRALEKTHESFKKEYQERIEQIEQEKQQLKEEIYELKVENVQSQGQIKVLKEQLFHMEHEKDKQISHAELLTRLSKSLQGCAMKFDSLRDYLGEKGI